MRLSRKDALLLCGGLVAMATMLLQSCVNEEDVRSKICGNWESVEGKPDVLIYQEGEAYKVTVFRRVGLTRRLKPTTYLLQEENGNLFINTGFRIDVAYNEVTDVLTLPAAKSGCASANQTSLFAFGLRRFSRPMGTM